MEKYILDANIFFNMEAGTNLGKKTNDVILTLTKYGKELQNKAKFLMPPSAVSEFLSFFEEKNQPVIKELFSVVTVRSPNKNKFNFSATVFYKLIEDIKNRSARGLNIGEEEIKKAGRLMLGSTNLNKKNFEIKIGTVIKSYRDRYRNATRVGFLDSVTDLDLVVLTKEVDGVLVSADQGVVSWGRVFGVKEVVLPAFRSRLDFLLDRRE